MDTNNQHFLFFLLLNLLVREFASMREVRRRFKNAEHDKESGQQVEHDEEQGCFKARERERDDSERMHCGLCANVKGERSTIKHYRLPVQCIQKCTVDLIGVKEVHSTCLKGKKLFNTIKTKRFFTC